MTCLNETKYWTVYDAKEKKVYSLTHQEFKNILLDRPVKLTGRFVYINNDKVWIDGLLNSDWLEKGR
jgi:hypothetical protein